MDRTGERWKVVPYIAIIMLAMPAIVLMGVWGRERVGGWNGLEDTSPFFRIILSAVTLYYLVLVTVIYIVLWRSSGKEGKGRNPLRSKLVRAITLLMLASLYLVWTYFTIEYFPDIW